MAFAVACFFVLLAAGTVAAFWMRPLWMPELLSVHGAAIDEQLLRTLAIAGAGFFLTHAALGFCVWRFRRRHVGAEASAWSASATLEWTWTLTIAAIFLTLGVQGNRIWSDHFNAPAPADAVVVEVTGQQFAWNIRYPGPDRKFGRARPELIDDSVGNHWGVDETDPDGRDDVTAQNILAIPAGRPVKIVLRSRDVLHSFFVPPLRVKQDAVPGMSIAIHFTATRAGEFEIACAELCGMQHYKMRARLLVLTDAAFDAWLKSRAEQ